MNLTLEVIVVRMPMCPESDGIRTNPQYLALVDSCLAGCFKVEHRNE